ncbi:sigma-70 family RNA polymerase sigma factor [Candidatus Peregrinibacteria bacterium]|nr:sigma-70 family RNA polymerase sigma factor [Candidatus Peregrinibacteria bacterium]
MDQSQNQNLEIEKFVHLAQKGDQEAFAKIYDIFVDQIYRYVYYRVQGADVEDIVETVFLKVWENIRQYKPQKKSFSAWLFRIAHNLVVDHYRAYKDKIFDELSSDLPDQSRQHNPIRSAQSSFDNLVLKKALVKVKKQYREIILHKFINELSNSEIAEILGKSEGSLRILQFRALKALRKELEEMGINY